MRDRILVIDDNRVIHDDYRKILESAEKETAEKEAELGELEALFRVGPPVTGCSVDGGSHSNGCQRYQVTSAYQGDEGLALVKAAIERNEPFAVTFVDMRMPPGWDGLETIYHLWEVDPELQVVICTAYSDHSWSEITRRFPNEHRLLLLKKPFDVVEVCQLASALTQKWHAEQTTKATLHNLEETVGARTAEIRHELEMRRHTEAALRASESEFAAIFETAGDCVVITEEDGTIVRCNSAMRRLTGKSLDDLKGSNLSALLADAHKRPPEEIFVELIQGESRADRELELAGGDRKVVPVLASTSEFRVAGQRRFTVTLRDMTEQKKMQRELTQAQKLESIGQLAAGIAHEINTPMQCVSGNVEFLRNCYQRLFEVLDLYREHMEGPERSWQERKEAMDRLKSECRYDHIRQQAPPAVEEAADAVKKVIEIVRAMKAMSHPGTQDKVHTNVNELIRSATTISRNRWKYAAELVLDLEEKLPDIMALPAELNQVMLNLIVNAADAVLEKSSPESTSTGTITIRTLEDKDGVRIEVEDTGCGIPDHVKQRIFDPFFTTKQVGKGTGQGLAITYDAVVNKHGGKISVDTVPGEGSTFSVWLPLEASSQSAPTKPTEKAPAAELAMSN